MTRSRVLTGIISAVFFLTLVSSARADSLHPDMLLEKLIFAERHNLTVFDFERAETGYLYAGHFENNNGKHLGFSMTSVNRGPKLGIVKPQAPVILGAGALNAFEGVPSVVASGARRLPIVRRRAFGDDLMTVYALRPI